MVTAITVKEKIQGLIDKSNNTTGNSDTTLTDAVDTLVGGYGVDSAPVTEPITITENGVYPVPKGGSLEFGKEVTFKEVITDADFRAYMANATLSDTGGGTLGCIVIPGWVFQAIPVGDAYAYQFANAAGMGVAYALNASLTGATVSDGWIKTADQTPTDAPTIVIEEGAAMAADLATTAIFFDLETKSLDGWGDITVNVAGGSNGMIDVTELPTENIDETVIYRITETFEQSPQVYVAMQGSITTVEEYYTLLGMPIKTIITVVPDVPESMDPLDEATLTMPIYIIENQNGVAIVSQDGTVNTAKTLGGMLDLSDKGWIDDITAIAAEGVYSLRGGSYKIYHYWRYRNNTWAEFIIPVADVDELPTDNIDDSVCYHVVNSTSENADKYFRYEDHEFIEYSAGPNFYDFISGNDNTKHLILPNRITSIAPYAFYGRQYNSVKLPSTLTEIGTHAFYDCDALQTFYCTYSPSSWTIADDWINNDSIIKTYDEIYGATGGKYIFNEDNNEYYIKSNSPVFCKNVFIPSSIDGNSVTRLQSDAFANCSNLISITIPDSVTSIGTSAFLSCSNLENVSMSSNITDIPSYAFNGCALTDSTILNNIATIGQNAFTGCNFKELIIPNTVKTIGQSAFSGCREATKISIGSGVTSIGKSAFQDCDALTDIEMSDCAATIGDKAFDGNSNIKNVQLSKNLTQIGTGIFNANDVGTIETMIVPYIGPTINDPQPLGFFYNNTSNISRFSSLKTITVMGGDIAKKAFSKCSALTNVILEEGITSIGEAAFVDCASLVNLHIPNSVISVGAGIFQNTPKLEAITVGENNPNYYSQNNCLITKDTKTLVARCKTSVLPDDIIAIGDMAFSADLDLINMIIPDSVESIGIGAFYYCTNLTNIIIPTSVTNIATGAFQSCGALVDITYLGTMEQWNAITFGDGWNTSTGEYTIHCTDGDITKEVTET